MKALLRRKRFLIPLIVIFCFAELYLLTVFNEMSGLSTLRDLWIETAMSTAEHQWLAEKFFPQSVIDRVMQKRPEQAEVSSNPDYIAIRPATVAKQKPETGEAGVYDDRNELIVVDSPFALPVGSVDEFGNTVIVSDNRNEIYITAVKTAEYSAQIMTVKNPAQVAVAYTRSPGLSGQLMADIIASGDGIAGINANGFADDGGVGTGGDIIGWSKSGGTEWGAGSKNHYISAGFDRYDRFLIQRTSSFDDFRDMIQYAPALIQDGKALVAGSAGWGIQPRSAVGQRADGAVLLVTVDGRQLGHSLGITVGDLAELLLRYGAINASSCDGGSSSAMMYDGNIIGLLSTPMKTGRNLPNAVVVRRK